MWLFKWIIVPITIIGLTVFFISLEHTKHHGQTLCKEYGYIEYTYIPPDRMGLGEKYIFRKKLNPDGTIDETAKLIINLD